MSYITFATLCCVVLIIPSAKAQSSNDVAQTLVLTSVIFRHGDRTPDKETLYPKDPYINHTYPPFGIGALTLKGKRKSYQLGKLLHKRYAIFLGDTWDYEKSASYSSSYPRTQMTLQAVHAGLFPPAKGEEIDANLLWQPLDYTYKQGKDDDLIATYRVCLSFFKALDEYEEQSTEVQKFMEEKKDLRNYLTEHSGWNVNYTSLGSYLYYALQIEQECGHALPKWAEKVFPEALGELNELFHKILTSKLEFRKALMGNLFKKIIKTAQQKANGTLKPNGRKIYLYSGHDFNLMGFLATFEHWTTTPYNSVMLIELHNIDGVYGIKVYYHNYSTDDPVQIMINGCGKFCPIDKFVELFKDYLGDKWCVF